MPPVPIDHGSKSQDRIKDEPSRYAAGTDKNQPRPTPEELMAGSQAAMIRAAKKAIARARAAGLEPVLAKPSSTQSDS